MTGNGGAAPAGSLWEATAPPDPSEGPLSGEVRADVCVVGAGFTGLSATLELAGRGASVVCIDQGGAGHGASGRNGGQVLAGFKWSPDEIVAAYGAERGGRLAAFGGAAPEVVYGLIARHGIDCGLRRCGWLNAAVDGAAFDRLAGIAGQWAARGAPVRMLERAETAALMGTGRYRGAMLDERAGALNPLSYARGLAAAAQRLGARLHGGTRALSLERDGEGWRVSTAAGVVRAREVLLATNGYTDGLWSGLAQEVVPVHSLQVATRPLPEAVRTSILPGGQVVSDTQRILLYFRLDDRGRLVMGGRGSLGETNRDGLYRFVEDAACRLFPQIRRTDWEFRWAGKVALTADHLPRVHELAPGLRACLGYNGRGVAMASVMGRAMGEWIATGDAGVLPLAPVPLRPLPFHALRRPVLEAISAYCRLRDRMSWRRGSVKGTRLEAGD
ncbi:FAD-binding oxidoreductase [Limibaculum sp. FT325]|uniref:NAD(P)/FAD-dependent oxidoreductase n=1 Tax=Thermohalobaculum sediminis TaxID=2939436 RepID=UPI0020C05895|nr:FAD-binding oxidoreductase [Limibaculum sediminis]MCL5776144.1 FAD-binding oxidoreductase [Limibaculum sediminis]